MGAKGFLGCAALLAAGLLVTGCEGTTQPPTDAEVRASSYTADLEDQVDDLKNEVEDLEEENSKLEVALHEAEAPYQSPADARVLDESEWAQAIIAAKLVLGKSRIARGRIPLFADAVSLEEGVYWSLAEKKQFTRRFRDWYLARYGQ